MKMVGGDHRLSMAPTLSFRLEDTRLLFSGSVSLQRFSPVNKPSLLTIQLAKSCLVL